MAKKNVNKTQNQSEQTQGQKSHDFSELYSHNIVQAFAKKMKQENVEYFTLPKEELVVQFEDFLKNEYGDNILDALKSGKINGKAIDVEMNAIYNKGFTIHDFLDTKKSVVIQKNLSTGTHEQEAMNSSLLQAYNQRELLPQKTKDTFSFDDFIHTHGYQKKINQNGKVINIVPGMKATDHNIVTLLKAWKYYVNAEIRSDDERKQYYDFLDISHFDPTEKVVCVTAVRRLYDKIQRGGSTPEQKKKLLALANTVFGVAGTKNPVPAQTGWTTLSELEHKMKDFYHQASQLCTDKELSVLQDIPVVMKDCVLSGEKNELLPEGLMDIKLRDRKYSDLSRQFQHMANGFAQSDLINNIDKVVSTIDESIDYYAKTFNIPGNMLSFFEQFGSPMSFSQTKLSPEYKALKNEEKNLREKLAQEGLSYDDKKNLEAKLIEIQNNLIQHKDTEHTVTWDGYFEHIAQQVTQAQSIMGKDSSLGGNLKTILQDLRENNWDVATLGKDGQNALMQGALALQLMKVKDNPSFQTLGYKFEDYSQFVSSLYDMNVPNQSVIMTKDHQPIILNFTEKHFVGKPLEFHNIDISDIRDLSKIRVEFELDLDNNPDAEDFIRMMTGGPESQLIQDFFPQSGKDFPETITDSTKVVMTDKDGVQYEGYLSPTDVVGIENNEYDGDFYGGINPDQSTKTFILYSKPADQLRTDREYVTQKDKNEQKIKTAQGKEKPVFVNMDNLSDWQSIRPLEKRVTLSDQHLKALTLGHMVAQHIDSSLLQDEQVQAQVQQQLGQLDQKVNQELQGIHRDLGNDTEYTEQNYEDMSEAQEFLNSWNKLLKNAPCEIGTRIAVPFPKTIGKIHTLKTHPESEQLLSMTVKDIQYDDAGKIIGCTFGFDTLSRIGKSTMKDITLKGKGLDVIGDVFKSATYIDNINKDIQDYKSVLMRLQTQFNNKSYLWSNIAQMDFDGKSFLKGGQKVTRFIANEKAASKDKPADKKYDVEYTVEALLGGKYRIQSSAYNTGVADKDGKINNENISFDTTTDMAGMLLILANKNLSPYTEKEFQDYKNNSNVDIATVPQKKRKRYTLGVWKSVLQGKIKDIGAAIKKKLGAEEEEELRFELFNEANLLGRISNGWIGKTLDVFGINVIEDMADEAASEGMNYGWKKIEGVFQYLSKFHPAYNANGPAGMGMVKGMIDSAMKSYPNIPMKERWAAAGALLYTIDKMKNGYGKLTGYPVGTYVKIMFGPQYYDAFMVRYKRLEVEAQAPGAAGQDAQERLSMLEYNYIVSNVRGGDTLEKEMGYILPGEEKATPFYFQNIYSRKFANELGTALGKMKSYSFSPESDAVKGFVNTNNFEHIYGECKGHMADMRVEDCLQELVALQKMAKNDKDANKVDQLFMSGILTGVFVHNLSKDNKKTLAKIMRNSSIPYAKMVTQFDAPQKLQAILSLASGGKFDDWTYGKDKKKYNPNDINPTVNQSNKKDIIESFETWFGENRNQIMPFLHMDKESMDTDDNLIRVWKSQDPELKIFGKKVDPVTKMYVTDIMKDFYFERGRSVNIDNFNDDSGLIHTATLDEQFYPTINHYKDGVWDIKTIDYAELIRGNLKDDAPTGKESPEHKDRLMMNINNFFRYFNGIGGIVYNRNTIEQFYKYMRLAQNPQLSSEDRIRLIWFSLTQKIYDKGSLPDDVTEVFKKYMNYFEKNLDNFDHRLGQLHSVPSGGDDFGYVFEESLSSMIYFPKQQRSKTDQKTQNGYVNQYRKQGQDVLNKSMDQANLKLRSGSGNYFGSNNDKAIGKSVDDKIVELRGGKVVQTNPMQTVQRSQAVETLNQEKVDLSEILNTEKNIGSKSVINTNKQNNGKKSSNNDDLRDELDAIKEAMGLY